MLVVFFVNNTLGEEDVLEMEVTVSNESVQVQHEIEPPESLGDENGKEVIDCGISIVFDSTNRCLFPQ